jgi:hypothetical protein
LGEILRYLSWVIVVLLVLSPILLDVAFVFNGLSALQGLFPFWNNKSTNLILSDLLFVEGGLFLVLGALVAGVTLYTAWVPDAFRASLTKSIFNLKTIRKGREIPSGVIFGLIVLSSGLVYILAAIAVAS